jgi:hypothetical protein
VIIFLTRTPSAPAHSDNSRVIEPLTIERPLEILRVVIRPLRRSLGACELKKQRPRSPHRFQSVLMPDLRFPHVRRFWETAARKASR